MKLRFWGVRGSIPAPLLPQAMREKVLFALKEAGRQGVDLQNIAELESFATALPEEINSTVGGNTTCISIESDDQFIIFDAGSGMRELSQYLMNREFGRGKGHAYIFFTHTHWDHIQGFPFFVPAFTAGNQFDVYHIHPYVPRVLKAQMVPNVFPAKFADLGADIRFHQIEEEQEVVLGNLKINSIELQHPNKAYSYRIDSPDHSIVLASDGEYKRLDRPFIKRYIDFYREADILIFDAQYSVREAIIKEDWGHSSGLIGADIAKAARVKRLLLFHHDPTSTDVEIMRALKETREYLAHNNKGILIEVDVATEGMEINFDQAGNFAIKEVQIEQALCLELSGQFDGQASEIFTEYVLDVIKTGRANSIILDMSDLSELTMAGIRALLDARRNTYSMAIVNVPESVYRILELAGTTDFFAIYNSLDDALNANLPA